MEEAHVKETVEIKPNDIDFHDLEALLQQGLGNDELKLVDHHLEFLLPTGENYSSIVVKIDATVYEKEDAEKENLHIVAKAKIPSSEHLDIWTTSMKREIFAYIKLLPMYKDIEREAGFPETDIIDIAPKYMGHRVSFEKDGNYDKDCLILLENLKVKGYYNCDRQIGLDLEHSKKALSSLARYHAVGIAMKRKHPSFAKIAIENAGTTFDGALVDESFASVRKAFQKYSSLTMYTEVLDASIICMKNKWSSEGVNKFPGLWGTINHGDFWTNNILFHKSDSGEMDVKFVDWALYFHASALTDLPYFCCTSVQRVILNNHFDDLLNFYYETFIESLEKLDCDATMFTRESFDEELKRRAIDEFSMSALAIKFIHYKVDKGEEENRELVKNVFANESDVYEVSLKEIIDIYKARKWF